MNQTGATESVVIGIFLVAVVFTWDGLVRRHIRLSRAFVLTQVNVRGLPAVLLGSLSALVAFLDGSVIIQQLGAMAERCRGSGGCIAQLALSPLVSPWPVVVLMIIEVGAFSIWLMGAFEVHGPYRRSLIAPGVWFREKDLVDSVARRLQKEHLPSLSDDVVLPLASEMKQRIGLRAFSALTGRMPVAGSDTDRVVQALVNSPKHQNRQAPSEVLRVAASAIAEYYSELYKQVPQAYHRALNLDRQGRRK